MKRGSERRIGLAIGMAIGIMFIAFLLPISSLAADNLKVAVIDPASGPFAAVGDQSNKQYEMIADYINSKGGGIGEENRDRAV